MVRCAPVAASPHRPLSPTLLQRNQQGALWLSVSKDMARAGLHSSSVAGARPRFARSFRQRAKQTTLTDMQHRRVLGRVTGTVAPARREPYLLFCFALVAVVALMAVFELRIIHWFLIPVCLCGFICGRDALGWLSGRLDPFDPKGFIGTLGLHLFFLAPVLLVWWDMEYDIATRPDDWRPWLGILSAVTAIGLICYRACERMSFHRPVRASKRWTIDQDRVFAILIPALILSGIAQMYLWYQYGGIVGQLENYKSGDLTSISGRYKYQLLAGAFPILLLILLTVLRSRQDNRQGRYSVAFFLLGFTFVLYFVIDGLRGSRSSIIWTLFWATGIIHYFWRRLSARVLLIGLIPVFMFMYAYGLYKSYGARVVDVYQESGSISAMTERSGRTTNNLIVRELSRVDVQTFIVYRLFDQRRTFDLQMGATYAETVPRQFVPGWIWRGRPKLPRKAVVGAELHYGTQYHQVDGLSKVYGLGGEAMLNFSVYGVPVLFAIYGWFMGWYRRNRTRWGERDARLFLAPFFAIWFLTALVGDLDNLLTFTMTKGFFPAVVVLLLARRQPAEKVS